MSSPPCRHGHPWRHRAAALTMLCVAFSCARAQTEFVSLTIANNSDPNRTWTDGSSPEDPAVRSQERTWAFQVDDPTLRIAVEFLYLDMDSGCLLALYDPAKANDIARIDFAHQFATFDENLAGGAGLLPFGFPWFVSSSNELIVTWETRAGGSNAKGFGFRYTVVSADWEPEWVTHGLATLSASPTTVELSNMHDRAVVRLNDTTPCHWDLTVGAEGVSGPFSELGEIRVFREGRSSYFVVPLGASTSIDEFSSVYAGDTFDRRATYFAVVVRERADNSGAARIALRASQTQGHAQVVGRVEWKNPGPPPATGFGSAFLVEMSARFEGAEIFPPGYYETLNQYNVIHFIAETPGSVSFEAESQMDFRGPLSASGVVTEDFCDTLVVEIFETRPQVSEVLTVAATPAPQTLTDGSRAQDAYSSRYNVHTYTWHLRAPNAGERVQLEFSRFELATNGYVHLYDGPDKSFPELAVLGGSPAFNSHHNHRGFPYFWSTGQSLTVFYSVCENPGGCVPYQQKGFEALFSVLPSDSPMPAAVIPMASGIPALFTFARPVPGGASPDYVFQFAQLAALADAQEIEIDVRVLNGSIESADTLSIGAVGSSNEAHRFRDTPVSTLAGSTTTHVITGNSYGVPYAVLFRRGFYLTSADVFSVSLTLTYRAGPARVTVDAADAAAAKTPIVQVALASAPQQVLFELSERPFTFVAPQVGRYNIYTRGFPKAAYSAAAWYAPDAVVDVNANAGGLQVSAPFAATDFSAESPSVLPVSRFRVSDAISLSDGSLPGQPAGRAGEFSYRWLVDARNLTSGFLRLQFDYLDLPPRATLRVYRGGAATATQRLVELGGDAGERAVATDLTRFPALLSVRSSAPVLVEYKSPDSFGATTTGLGWKLLAWAEPADPTPAILAPHVPTPANAAAGASISPSAPESTTWFQTSLCATNLTLKLAVEARVGSVNAAAVSVTRLGVSEPVAFLVTGESPLSVDLLTHPDIVDRVRAFPGSEVIVDVTYPTGAAQSAPVVFSVSLEQHVVVPLQLNVTQGAFPVAERVVQVLDARGVLLANETSNADGLVLVQLPEGRFRLVVPAVSATPRVLDVAADPVDCALQTAQVAFDPTPSCPLGSNSTCLCPNFVLTENPTPWQAHLGREVGPADTGVNATGLQLRDAESAIWFADGNSMHSDAASGAIISPQEIVIDGIETGSSIRQLQDRLLFLEAQLAQTFSGSAEASCSPLSVVEAP